MSPEQLSAHRIRLDHRTDIFSLGVSLYEALTLKRPFDAPSREEIYQSILTKDPIDPRKHNRAMSRDVAVVIEKAMEKDRDRRFATAQEFAEDLERILELKPIQARPAGPIVKMTRWMQRNRALAGFILLLPVVGLMSIYAANKVEERHLAKDLESKRETHWHNLKSKFANYVKLQSNATLSTLFQTRSLHEIREDVSYLGADARQWIRSKIEDQSPTVRQAAIGVVIHVGDSGAADLLLDHCLHDQSKRVRIWCSQALFRIPDKTVVPYLIRILKESTLESCQVNALFGLAAFDAPNAGQMCLDFYFDSKKSAAMKYPLAVNVLMLGKPGLEKMAEGFASKLRPDDLQAWSTVLEYYRHLGSAESRKKLSVYADDENLSSIIQEYAKSALRRLDADSEENVSQ